MLIVYDNIINNSVRLNKCIGKCKENFKKMGGT
jgi:hypothetical protein